MAVKRARNVNYNAQYNFTNIQNIGSCTLQHKLTLDENLSSGKNKTKPTYMLISVDLIQSTAPLLK